jgi:site-specific recombinase XerC
MTNANMRLGIVAFEPYRSAVAGPAAMAIPRLTMRLPQASLIYRRTGNLRAVQLLLGHKKIEKFVRYLGIEVDDALAIAEQVDI